MIKIFRNESVHSALSALTETLNKQIRAKLNSPFHLALSGGTSAQMLFKLWTEHFRDSLQWNTVRFYWVDERCVATQDPQSNFGEAFRLFFHPEGIAPEHIHRIHGEAVPQQEAPRYAKRVSELLTHVEGKPQFDAIILGAGTDGHTASIFPDSMSLLTEKKLYAVSKHPQTAQQRITMTGPLILNATRLYLPILGQDKTQIASLLLDDPLRRKQFPAGYILDHARDVSVYTDIPSSGPDFHWTD